MGLGLPDTEELAAHRRAEAGQRSAIISSIIESCRRRGIDPHAYLRDVLTRLPHLPTETNRTVHRLTPNVWVAEAARRKSVAQAAAMPALRGWV